MILLYIKLDKPLCKEVERKIGFISQYIINYTINKEQLILNLEECCNKDKIYDEISKLVKSDTNDNSEIIYTKIYDVKYVTDNNILQSGIVKKYDKGMIYLNEIGLLLYNFFDNCFKELIYDYNLKIRKYPTLLPITTYKDTNYLRSSPQYAILCKSVIEDMENYKDNTNIEHYKLAPALYALSPSACFHLYEELRNKELKKNTVFTFRQNVFRNEGRFNWNEITRMRDYNVREIVFIGDYEFVNSVRENILHRTKNLVENLGLNYQICVASDPFTIPKMLKYKKIQIANKLKYEIRLNVSENERVACGSFNLHGYNFSKSFNFSVAGQDTVSGCIGFGIERWIICFLKQYGCNKNKWPKRVKEYIYPKTKNINN